MLGEIAALGAAFSWTVSAILYKEALAKTKPVSANVVRLAFTGLFLLVLLVVLGKFRVLTSLPLYVVVLAGVSGLIGLGLGDTLYLLSLKLIGVARAVPITCVYPLFNILWAIFVAKETVTLPVVAGATIIVLGIWLLSKEQEGKQSLDKKSMSKGIFFALATALAWSISIAMIDIAVTVPETGSLDHAFVINTIRVIAIAASLLVLAPLADRKFEFLKMDKRTATALISGGFVALGIGWFLLTYSFLHIPQSQAVPISSTTPLFSTLTSIAILKEHVTLKTAVGAMAIVAGIFLVFTV
jgi:drug/metabolite transporter (DMT)-like permease